jgi:predicted nucleic acid-binding protein
LILYSDTSSLAKLYILEEGSAEMRRLVLTVQRVTCSEVAYAETRVAIARALREGRLDESAFRQARRDFEADWVDYGAVTVGDILKDAGDLGDRYAIRGFDAIHLASALRVRQLAKQDVSFASADRRLRDAAVAEGFALA